MTTNDKPVGEAVLFPGFEEGITVAVFNEAEVPVGTKLYDHPQPAAPRVPEGWVLVPLDPTPEMMRAAQDNPEYRVSGDGAYRTYRAMLNAAPPAPEQPKPGTVTVPREVVAAYARSTHIPRHRRICEAALGEVNGMHTAKYPYEKLNPGEAVEFESDKSLASVRVAALAYGERHGKKYKVDVVDTDNPEHEAANVLRVTRVE